MNKMLYKNPQIEIETGYVNSIIIDFDNKKIFTVNQNGTNILKRIENHLSLNEDRFFIDELKQLNFFSNQPYTIKQSDYQYSLYNFFWIEITDHCNLDCIHCYNIKQKTTSTAVSVHNMKAVMQELRNIGFNAVKFIGGEPHLEKNTCIDLIYNAKSIGINSIQVFTNLTILDDSLINCYKKNDVIVCFSIYSHHSEVHDQITCINGSFNKLKKNLLTLASHGVKLIPALHVLPQNVDHIHETKKILTDIGFPVEGFYHIRPIGRARIMPKSLKNNIFNNYPSFTIERDFYHRSKKFNSCWNGILSVNFNGDIYPCVMHKSETIKNIKYSKIENIIDLLDSSNFWRLNMDLVKTCKFCEFRYICNDCRPLATELTGDKYEKNPYCNYDPMKGEWENEKNELYSVNNPS